VSLRLLVVAWLAGCALPPPGEPLAVDDDADGFPASEDCDDLDPDERPDATWALDLDGDGWAGDTVASCERPEGALATASAGADCDDADPAAQAIVEAWPDVDGDGWPGEPSESFCGAIPSGYATESTDCAPDDPSLYDPGPWYRGVDGVNQAFLIYFQFEDDAGISTFASSHFFPLDGAGWGDSGEGNDDQQHNFHFTTELHTKFQYNGGEIFKFSGDDDLWVFINGKLVLDVGGLHPAVSQAIDLDAFAAALGMTKGNVYSLDLFHAERHSVASHFRVDSTLTFVDCGIIPPDVVVK
jgi:fibro-slime domain-containing protein